MGGRVIMLVGASSVGKTSVAEQLQLQLDEPFLHVGLDHFFSMFPHRWKGHPRGPGPGFWYDDSVDPDGSARARIRYGEAGERLLAGMRAAVNSLLSLGNDVIVDEMPLDASILPAWRRDLQADREWWVNLRAPLAVVEERERGRTRGRHLGNARGHYDVAGEQPWDDVVDVTSLTPDEAARRIIARCPFLQP